MDARIMVKVANSEDAAISVRGMDIRNVIVRKISLRKTMSLFSW